MFLAHLVFGGKLSAVAMDPSASTQSSGNTGSSKVSSAQVSLRWFIACSLYTVLVWYGDNLGLLGVVLGIGHWLKVGALSCWAVYCTLFSFVLLYVFCRPKPWIEVLLQKRKCAVLSWDLLESSPCVALVLGGFFKV